MASVIRIAITGSARDAVRALNETRDAAVSTQRSLAGMSTTTGVAGIVGKVAAARITGLGLAIAAAAPYAVMFTRALSPMLGYLVTVPALAGAAAGVFAALKIATAGVGDALSSGLAGDLKKYQTAMLALQPAQRAFVASIVALRQPIASLKATVASGFFAPFAKDVAPLARVLIPVLSSGLARVGRGLGIVVDRFAKAARSGPLIGGITAVLGATSTALVHLAPLAGRFADTIGRVLTASAPTLDRFVGSIGKLADKFLAFLDRSANPLAVTRWFDQAQAAASDLWAIGKNVAGVLQSIFSAGGTAGASGLLGTIRDLTGRLDTFLKSTQGKADLARYFKAASDAAAVVLYVMRHIVPSMSKLVGYAAEFAGWLEKHKRAGALLAGLFVVSKFLGPMFALLRAFAIAKLLYGILKSTLTIIGQKLATTAADLSATGIAARNAERRAAADAVSAGAAQRRAAADELDALAVGRSVKGAPVGAAGKALPLAGIATAAGGAGLTVGLALAAVVAWGIAIYEIVHNWDQLKRFVSQDLHSMGTALANLKANIYQGIGVAVTNLTGTISLAVGSVAALPNRIIGYFAGLAGRFVQLGRNLVSGLVNGLFGRLTEAKDSVLGVGSRIISWLKQAVGAHSDSRLAFSIGQNIGGGLAAGLRASQSHVLAQAQGLASTIAGGINPAIGAMRVDKPTASAKPVNIQVHVPVGANLAKAGETMKQAIRAHERESGHRLLASTA